MAHEPREPARAPARTDKTAAELEAIKRRLEHQHDALRNRKPVDGRDSIDAGDPVEMNPLTPPQGAD